MVTEPCLDLAAAAVNGQIAGAVAGPSCESIHVGGRDNFLIVFFKEDFFFKERINY